MRNVDRRSHAIMKVVTELVQLQDVFFTDLMRKLRPLTLAAVLERCGVCMRAVSRFSKNECISTPRATYEIRFVFPCDFSGRAGGEAHASEAALHQICDLVDGRT